VRDKAEKADYDYDYDYDYDHDHERDHERDHELLRQQKAKPSGPKGQRPF